LHLYEIFFWSGLILLIACCCCFGLVGIRNSVFGGPYRSLTAELRPFDIKLSKLAGVLFIISILLFVIGFVLQ